MNISWTPEVKNAAKAKVSSGLDNNASEVIAEALQESLRREATIGFAQLDSGQRVPVNSKKAFLALVREAP